MAPPQTPGPTQAFPPAAVSVHGAVYNPVAPVVPPGQQCATQCDSGGNTLVSVVNSVVPGNVGSQTTTITNSTTKTAIVSNSGGSPPAGTYAHITGLQITNQSSTAVTITLNDGAMNRKIYDIAANGGIVVLFPWGLLQSSAPNEWYATLSVSTVTVDINVDFIETALASL